MLRRKLFVIQNQKTFRTSSYLSGKYYSDMVGPRDEVSNLRKMKFEKIPNETPLQKLYREKRIQTYDWNQSFWSQHNKNFVKEKQTFIKENTNEDKCSLNADEMSVFYKQFLDRNWNNHLNYNIAWYKKNFDILFLSIRVDIEKLWLKVKL